MEGEILSTNRRYCAGKVVHHTARLTLHTPSGGMAFPVQLFLPVCDRHAPVILHICFRPDFPDRYTPVEEITDHGFALAMFNYQDIATDDADFTNGLAALYVGGRPRGRHEWGKIGMWAYAASRVLDWLETIPEADTSRAVVTGHSRLGKTALWCAAQDERFAAAISNDSGCAGAAVERGKVGEHVREITRVFPFWFAPKYAEYAENPHAMPADQHFLTALMAPRLLYIASAAEDIWADPASEFLCAVAASEAYAAFGVPGLVPVPEYLPEAPAAFHDGRLGYHVRRGLHYYSREDWGLQLAFLQKHLK